MTNLLRYAEDDATVAWSEDDLQMAVVRTLRRLGVLYATDPNPGRQSKQSGARRKALGLVAGEPDVRLYLATNCTVFVELKKWTGTVSKEQKDRHTALRELGYPVYIVKAKTPADAVDQIVGIVQGHKPQSIYTWLP